MEGADVERGNAMERLDPIQGGPSKGIKRHSRWDLSQVSSFWVNLKGLGVLYRIHYDLYKPVKEY